MLSVVHFLFYLGVLEIANRVLTGRRVIKTSVERIDAKNVVKVLAQAYVTHLTNRDEIEYLYKYYKGRQPILDRVKEIRPEINNMIVENRANAIVSFRVGYTCGKPVQYVSSVADESVSNEIARLNDLMRYAGKGTKDKALVEWMMICGLDYRFLLPSEDPRARVPFEIYTVDPRNAFVVYRNDIAQTPLCGVYYTVSDTQDVTFHVYTDTEYFRIEGSQPGKIVETSKNVLGRIPLIEYPLNMARIGAFEVILPLLDCINTLDSNDIDSVEQTVQSLLVAVNCNFDEGTTANEIRQAGMVVLKSVGENKADIKMLNEPVDQTQAQVLKQSILDAINEIAGIPSQSNGRSSDSSNNGAVILRNGWQGAETRAQDFEMMFREPEMRMLEIVTDICRSLSDINIDPMNIDIKFTRRNYEDLLSKSQTLTTMLGNDKIHPQCAYEASGLFVDTQDAYNMGMDWFNKHGGGAVNNEPPVTENENAEDDISV